jgi:NAD(P)H dehydrogenase (quinone)
VTAPSIAVTGATGQIGSRVARRLARLGVPQCLIVRDPSRAPDLPGAQVSQASYEDADAVRRALDGVSTLFLVSATEQPGRVGLHRATIDAAAGAGVERIVYTSFLGAAPDATFTFARDHWHTEQHLRASGVAATFLRDSLYLDFLPRLVGGDGVIRGPAGAGRVGAVAQDDVADAAVAVLTQKGHDGRTYNLTGPEALTLEEAAQRLSRITRPVTYHPETLEEAYASRQPYGAPDWEVAGWVSTYLAIANGELDLVTSDVQTLIGHAPLDLEEVMRRA